MQLTRLVQYHKALADPTRIRILVLLAHGPLHGQAIAGKLGLSAPTVTHHMAKLREAGLVKERRDKNTIYFTMNEDTLKKDGEATVRFVLVEESQDVEEKSTSETEQNTIVRNFFTHDGKLKNIPAQRKKKLMVLAHLVRGLKPGIKYPEKELNAYIQQFHEDYATIRREFIMHQFMYRESSVYELNPPEMWAKP